MGFLSLFLFLIFAVPGAQVDRYLRREAALASAYQGSLGNSMYYKGYYVLTKMLVPYS